MRLSLIKSAKEVLCRRFILHYYYFQSFVQSFLSTLCLPLNSNYTAFLFKEEKTKSFLLFLFFFSFSQPLHCPIAICSSPPSGLHWVPARAQRTGPTCTWVLRSWRSALTSRRTASRAPSLRLRSRSRRRSRKGLPEAKRGEESRERSSTTSSPALNGRERQRRWRHQFT